MSLFRSTPASRVLAPALLALAALAMGCGGPKLACEGPNDCKGNACCYSIPVSAGGGSSVYCTDSASACPSQNTLDFRYYRLCQTDADCTAGGISTNENVCCPASVMDAAAKACTSLSQCPSRRASSAEAQ